MKAKNVQSVIYSIIIFLFASGAWAADWVLCNTPNEGKVYYDKSSIKKVSKNNIRVWTKTILNKDGKNRYFLFLQRINQAPDKPDIMNYELMLNEIDCANERGRFSSMTINYDEKAVVYWGSKSFSQWMKIDPRSTMGILKNKVCGAGKTSGTKKK